MSNRRGQSQNFNLGFLRAWQGFSRLSQHGLLPGLSTSRKPQLAAEAGLEPRYPVWEAGVPTGVLTTLLNTYFTNQLHYPDCSPCSSLPNSRTKVPKMGVKDNIPNCPKVGRGKAEGELMSVSFLYLVMNTSNSLILHRKLRSTSSLQLEA